jgi:hypothetical protein
MKTTNDKMYSKIKGILATYGESNTASIFSEYIDSLDQNLNITNYIIMITHNSLYLMDEKFQKNQIRRNELKNLRQIIMIKTNPCIFALSFGNI